MTSHNPNDVAESYCGNCHDWTGRDLAGQSLQGAAEKAIGDLANVAVTLSPSHQASIERITRNLRRALRADREHR